MKIYNVGAGKAGVVVIAIAIIASQLVLAGVQVICNATGRGWYNWYCYWYGLE